MKIQISRNNVWTETQVQAETANRAITQAMNPKNPAYKFEFYSLYLEHGGQLILLCEVSSRKVVSIDKNGKIEQFPTQNFELNLAAGDAKQFTGLLDVDKRKPVYTYDKPSSTKVKGLEPGTYVSAIGLPSCPTYLYDEKGQWFRFDGNANPVKLTTNAKDPWRNKLDVDDRARSGDLVRR